MSKMLETAPARFWAKVDKTGDCWIWKAAKLKSGYGKLMVTKTHGMTAHRYSYTLHNGEIPKGMFVCHSCDNPPCVNPSHLWLGTAKDNSQDAKKKGRTAVGDKNGMRTKPHKRSFGQRNGFGKLTDRDVAQILKLRRDGISGREVASKFGISRDYVYELTTSKTTRGAACRTQILTAIKGDTDGTN